MHVPNLVCIEQFCSRCENIRDINIDCKQYGTLKHAFGDDPVGDLFIYLCKSRPLCDQIVVIAHKAKEFDLRFFTQQGHLVKMEARANSERA